MNVHTGSLDLVLYTRLGLYLHARDIKKNPGDLRSWSCMCIIGLLTKFIRDK